MSKENTVENATKPMAYDALLGTVALLSELPKSYYELDVWDDGKTFLGLDTENGLVTVRDAVRQPCGCCDNYEVSEREFGELYLSEQFLILAEMVERYCA